MSNRHVNPDWVELALNVTAKGLEETISASGVAMWAEHEAKKTKAELMLSSLNPEKSATMREAWAITKPEYDAAYRKFCDARGAEIDGKDKFKRAESIISAWQTEERSITRGNI